MSYSAFSVLHGGAHTVCSMLEGLYLSVLDISTDGHSTRHPPTSVSKARIQRSEQRTQQLEDEHAIAPKFKLLVLSLRDLFFPSTSDLMRGYNRKATAAEVHELCKGFMPDIEIDERVAVSAHANEC